MMPSRVPPVHYLVGAIGLPMCLGLPLLAVLGIFMPNVREAAPVGYLIAVMDTLLSLICLALFCNPGRRWCAWSLDRFML